MTSFAALARELRAGCPRLEGAQVLATIPIRQALVDELLTLVPGVPDDLSLTLGPDRQVQVRYGVFHANGRLSPAFGGESPRLTLELASQLVAWGLQRLPLPPFVAVQGRLIHVDLQRVPALAPLAPVWPHVQSVSFTSIAGRLDVRVAVHVRRLERSA